MSTKSKHRCSRILSLLLAIVMIASLIPVIETDADAYAAARALPALTGNQAQDVVNIALSQLGYTEGRGGGTVFGAWWTKTYKGNNTYAAWCAMFACWCANQAGVGKGITYGMSSASASGFVSYLRQNGKVETSFATQPKTGDFIFFGNRGSVSHIAIVVMYDAKTNVVTFVGGNQSDTVKKATTTWSSSGRFGKQFVMGYARPNYLKVEKTAAPTVTTEEPIYYPGQQPVISWPQVPGTKSYAMTIMKDGQEIISRDMGLETSYTLENPSEGSYSVTVTSSNGFIPSDPGSCEFKVSEVKPGVRLWLSESTLGAEQQKFMVGRDYYLCYELYDELTGMKIDSVKAYDYLVTLNVVDSQGRSRRSETFTTDTNSASLFFDVTGEYTVTADVTGALEASQTVTLTAGENSNRLHVSQPSVVLSSDGEITVYVWSSGHSDDEITLLWQRSNTNISCAWVEKTKDGKMPLVLTANTEGTTEVVLASKITGSNEILEMITLHIKVDPHSYSISYDANGGVGAAEPQTKTHGEALSLQMEKPEREGYIFLGWATEADAAMAEYQPGTVFLVDARTTLYAVWSDTFLNGDTNVDGTVNMKDWNCLYEHNNEASDITGDALELADVNGDGVVNMKDWARLYEHVSETDPLW